MRAPRFASEAGTTLVEVTLAMAVLMVGALGAAGVFTSGMQKATSSPGDLIATQKAQEAVESVFAARDSHKLTWAQIRNVNGPNSGGNGIFLDGPLPLKRPGPDGLINTADDDAQLESVVMPGPDAQLGTADDVTQALTEFTREVVIRDVSLTLRSLTVIIRYRVGQLSREYQISTLISSYA